MGATHEPDPDDPCPTCGHASIDLCGECHRPLDGGDHEACAMTLNELLARIDDPDRWSGPECPEARA